MLFTAISSFLFLLFTLLWMLIRYFNLPLFFFNIPFYFSSIKSITRLNVHMKPSRAANRLL